MNPEVTVEQVDEHVVVVEVHRPPNNFFDVPLLEAIATAYEALDNDARIRAIVLAAEGKHFCAGADFTGRSGAGEVSADAGARALYTAAVRLFSTAKPVVAAVQGAAIGGGWDWPCPRTFGSAPHERDSPPISPDWASTKASGCR
jgi:2-(1,2-epoxy-1,2-dihydrophenyl)acetyl-CoA isomerase